MKLEEINIKQEINNAIERSGRQRKDIALSINYTPQNLANVLNIQSRKVPLELLVRIANELADNDLYKVINQFLFHRGVNYHSDALKEPLNTLVMATKEQSEREVLEAEAEVIFAKPATLWTREEYRFIKQQYLKEFDEELGSENEHRDSIDDALKVAEEVGIWI